MSCPRQHSESSSHADSSYSTDSSSHGQSSGDWNPSNTYPQGRSAQSQLPLLPERDRISSSSSSTAVESDDAQPALLGYLTESPPPMPAFGDPTLNYRPHPSNSLPVSLERSFSDGTSSSAHSHASSLPQQKISSDQHGPAAPVRAHSYSVQPRRQVSGRSGTARLPRNRANTMGAVPTTSRSEIPSSKGRTSTPQTPVTARSYSRSHDSSHTAYTVHPPLPRSYAPNVAMEAHFLYDSKEPEDDDYLHDPAVERPDEPWLCAIGWKGLLNIASLMAICFALMGCLAIFPIVSELEKQLANGYGFRLGGINGTGQVPDIPNLPSLIDRHTPKKALTRTGFDGSKYNLVFSDEFEVDGRTFFPGDDPFWEAVDLHYWATGDMEWYDPDAITTAGGSLVITIDQQRQHDLDYRSGMLQSWNKLCFTGGYVEVSLQLPGSDQMSGFWPGVWSLGNLGRAGYGATTEGVWPYSYDSCDVGTRPNQTTADFQSPAAAAGGLSWQPGQRFSACTCKGEDHPGPDVKTGRGAPEIDAIEAVVFSNGRRSGGASQSAQIAPYDPQYSWATDKAIMHPSSPPITFNNYKGGPLQECASALIEFPDSDGYQATGGFSTYGFEYTPGAEDEGRITWFYRGEPTWTLTGSAIGRNDATQVGPRLISQEPMYMILNLGLSSSFQTLDWNSLTFPAQMRVDYVRIYQKDGEASITCDPESHPTSDYIQRHINAYTNANLSEARLAGIKWPRQTLVDECKQ